MLNNKIKVFARIKPPKDSVHSHIYEIRTNISEHGGKKILLLHGEDEKYCAGSSLKLHSSTEEFLFENVFTETASQETIYNSMAKPVIERAIEGFNGTIMAYGQTGTGKTHTICGGRDKGIIPRAFKDVFHIMKEQKQSFKVFLSVMEIYNEHAYDLLNDRHTKIGMRRHKTKQVTPRNLRTVQVSSMHQLEKLLRRAWNNRIISETPMNDASSRSHCIFSLHLHQNNLSSAMISKVHMIDLSGSEKLGKRRPSGVLLNETRHINLSLHYIELVIRALSDKNRDHIPYRNSMITSFLRDSLGGNSNTVMVFTLSLDPMFYEETIFTCRFAQRVSLISNKMKKQISQINEIEMMKNENAEQLAENNAIKNSNEFQPLNVDSYGNHKGINCKLDVTSSSSSSSSQGDLDKRSVFDDEDLSKCLEELLSEEDMSSLNNCNEKHLGEERISIIELDGIQRSLNGLIELTKAFKMFSQKTEDNNRGNYYIYERLGLCLPSRNPESGKLYKTTEKEEFYKFLSRSLNINNFKTEYYDEYCDLLIKEYHASSALNKNIVFLERSKCKLQARKNLMNPERIERYKKKLALKEIIIKEKETLLEEIKRERNALLLKVNDIRNTLIKQFNEEWLPEKENVIIYPCRNGSDKYFSRTDKINSKDKVKKEKLKDFTVNTSKTLGKSKSNTIEYQTKSKIPKIKFQKNSVSFKGINTTSDVTISNFQDVSNLKGDETSEESEK